jgi:hypothetical protein
MLFAMVMIDDKIDDDKQMYLCCRPFQWPCGHIEVMHVALPDTDTANPGTHQIPLEAGDNSLRSPPATTRAKINKTTIKQQTHFAGRFHGHCNATVQYRVHCLMEEV